MRHQTLEAGSILGGEAHPIETAAGAKDIGVKGFWARLIGVRRAT